MFSIAHVRSAWMKFAICCLRVIEALVVIIFTSDDEPEDEENEEAEREEVEHVVPVAARQESSNLRMQNAKSLMLFPLGDSFDGID